MGIEFHLAYDSHFEQSQDKFWKVLEISNKIFKDKKTHIMMGVSSLFKGFLDYLVKLCQLRDGDCELDGRRGLEMCQVRGKRDDVERESDKICFSVFTKGK